MKVSEPRPSRNTIGSKQTVIVIQDCNVCVSKVQSMFSVPMATTCYQGNKQLEEASSFATARSMRFSLMEQEIRHDGNEKPVQICWRQNLHACTGKKTQIPSPSFITKAREDTQS